MGISFTCLLAVLRAMQDLRSLIRGSNLVLPAKKHRVLTAGPPGSSGNLPFSSLPENTFHTQLDLWESCLPFNSVSSQGHCAEDDENSASLPKGDLHLLRWTSEVKISQTFPSLLPLPHPGCSVTSSLCDLGNPLLVTAPQFLPLQNGLWLPLLTCLPPAGFMKSKCDDEQ